MYVCIDYLRAESKSAIAESVRANAPSVLLMHLQKSSSASVHIPMTSEDMRHWLFVLRMSEHANASAVAVRVALMMCDVLELHD